MRMAALPARDVEESRAARQREDIHQAGDFAAILGEVEDRLVLQQILGVEVRRPPVGLLRARAQKNTGSRYAPNTSSSARRIS
jgi:hypothetical protein